MIENKYTAEQIEANRLKWLAALESGKYSQAQFTLYNQTEGGFCCLGVYTDLCPGVWKAKPDSRDMYKYVSDVIGSPHEFTATLTPDQRDQLGIDLDIQQELVDMNDGGSDFGEIARYLRSKWNIL